MKYKKYLVESPLDKLNNTNKFENKFNELESHQADNDADYLYLYKEYRDLLRTTGITEAQEYSVRLKIYELFLKGFCESIGGLNQKVKNFFDEVTKTVKPVGSKGNGMEFGTSQLRFWSQFIEAYNWKEILNPNNVFKKVILWILQNSNGLNESLIINEAGKAYISPEELEKNPGLNKKVQQALRTQQKQKDHQQDDEPQTKFIPKINNYKAFQDLYNMYVHHELDEFDPDSPNPLGFLENEQQTKDSKQNRNFENKNKFNPDDLSTEEAKNLYNSLYTVFNNRLNLNLKEI